MILWIWVYQFEIIYQGDSTYDHFQVIVTGLVIINFVKLKLCAAAYLTINGPIESDAALKC